MTGDKITAPAVKHGQAQVILKCLLVCQSDWTILKTNLLSEGHHQFFFRTEIHKLVRYNFTKYMLRIQY